MAKRASAEDDEWRGCCLLRPADLGDVVMLCQRVQVSVELLDPLLVSLGCLLHDPFYLPLFLHLEERFLGLGPMNFFVQRFRFLLPLFFRGGGGADVFHHLVQALVFLFLFDSGGVLEFKAGFRDIIGGGGKVDA